MVAGRTTGPPGEHQILLRTTGGTSSSSWSRQAKTGSSRQALWAGTTFDNTADPETWPKPAPTVYDTEYSIRFADPDARLQKEIDRRADRTLDVERTAPMSGPGGQIDERENKFTQRLLDDLMQPKPAKMRPIDDAHQMRSPQMYRSYSAGEVQTSKSGPVWSKACLEPWLGPTQPNPEMTHARRRHREDYPADEARWYPQEGKQRYGKMPRSFDGGRAPIPFRRFTGLTTYGEDRRRSHIAGTHGGGWRVGVGQRAMWQAQAAFARAEDAAAKPRGTGERMLERLPSAELQYVPRMKKEILYEVLKSKPSLELVMGSMDPSVKAPKAKPQMSLEKLPAEEPHIDPRWRDSPRLVAGMYTSHYDYDT